MPADRTPPAAYTPAPGGFLERNPHLVENYLTLCAELGETPGEVPEEVGAIGLERPPEHIFEAFRRLHFQSPQPRPWWVVLAAWWRNRECFTIREAWGWFR